MNIIRLSAAYVTNMSKPSSKCLFLLLITGTMILTVILVNTNLNDESHIYQKALAVFRYMKYKPKTNRTDFQPLTLPRKVQPLTLPRKVQPVTRPRKVQPVTRPRKVQPVTRPRKVKSLTRPRKVKPLTRPRKVKPLKRPRKVKPLKRPRKVKPVTRPRKVKPLKRPRKIKPLTRPRKVKTLTRPPKVQPVTRPPKVQPVTRPRKVQPVTRPLKVQPVTRPPKVQPVTRPPKVQPVTPPLKVADSPRKKYIIYKCIGGIGAVHCSGWGNRLIGIVASYIIANATGRTYGILMNHPCELTRFLIPNDYNWNISTETLKNMSSKTLSVRNNRGFTNTLTTVDFNKKYPQDVIYISCNHEYHKQLLGNKIYKKRLKWLSRITTGDIYKLILLKLFKLHKDTQHMLDDILKIARPKPNIKLMCAQVRMGKNPTIPWDNRPMNTMEGVHNIWKFFHKYNNSDSIFVTTDSSKVRKEAKTIFGNRTVDTSGPIIHIDKAYRGSPCLGMQKLILDQWVLVNCDILVVSTSSFGLLPAFIRRKYKSTYLFTGGKVRKW